MEHWQEPEPLAAAQRTGYSSPVINGLGQEAAASVQSGAPTVSPDGRDQAPRRRHPRPGPNGAQGRMLPEHMRRRMMRKAAMPFLVGAVVGFFVGGWYSKRS